VLPGKRERAAVRPHGCPLRGGTQFGSSECAERPSRFPFQDVCPACQALVAWHAAGGDDPGLLLQPIDWPMLHNNPFPDAWPLLAATAVRAGCSGSHRSISGWGRPLGFFTLKADQLARPGGQAATLIRTDEAEIDETSEKTLPIGRDPHEQPGPVDLGMPAQDEMQHGGAVAALARLHEHSSEGARWGPTIRCLRADNLSAACVLAPAVFDRRGAGRAGKD